MDWTGVVFRSEDLYKSQGEKKEDNIMDLQTLKKKLLNDKELAPLYNFFLDHFGENRSFMELGAPVELPLLEAIVAQIAEQMFPRGGDIVGLHLTRLADERFVHGAFFKGGRIGGVFFFEDGQTGLVALSDLAPSIEVKYARFSAKIQAPDPSRN